jgi:hypothetical protein
VTAVQVTYSEFIRWTSPPALVDDDLERMSVDEIELLLRMRLQAFVRRGYSWQQALALTVTAGAK